MRAEKRGRLGVTGVGQSGTEAKKGPAWRAGGEHRALGVRTQGGDLASGQGGAVVRVRPFTLSTG